MAHSDRYMQWDDTAKRYYLTEEALNFIGIDYKARFNEGSIEDAGRVIRRAIVINTNAVYSYLHGFVFDTDKQDKAIEKFDSCRKKMFDALCANMLHLSNYGDMRNSPDERERAVAIPADVKAVFDEIIPELGHTLTYAGRWY